MEGFYLIIQEFYWNENKILTLCHENIGETISDRKLEESIKISNNDVVFKEYAAEHINLEYNECDLNIKGFLDCNNEKNPYNNYCTFYNELVSPYNNGDNLVFSDKEFKKLYDFVKEFSNYPITHNSIGNILIFSPIKISVKSHGSESYPYLSIK